MDGFSELLILKNKIVDNISNRNNIAGLMEEKNDETYFL